MDSIFFQTTRDDTHREDVAVVGGKNRSAGVAGQRNRVVNQLPVSAEAIVWPARKTSSRTHSAQPWLVLFRPVGVLHRSGGHLLVLPKQLHPGIHHRGIVDFDQPFVVAPDVAVVLKL